MSNVILAAKRTTTDVLNTVTVTTGLVNEGVESLAALAQAGSSAARTYRDRIIKESVAREAQHEYSASLSDALFYREIQNELRDDPELERLFQQSLKLRQGALETPPSLLLE